MKKRGRKGAVLIFVLFSVFFLSLMALLASYNVRLRLEWLKRRIAQEKSFHLAAGLLKVVLEDLKAAAARGIEKEYRSRIQDGEKQQLKNFIGEDGKNEGTYQVFVRDEKSRININNASFESLEKLLGNFKKADQKAFALQFKAYGESEKEKKIFRSVYEFREFAALKTEEFLGEDINENGILDPWENDGEKSPPQDDADGRLDLGVKDFITVYTDGRINVNTASWEVLTSMPGMDEQSANWIIKEREDKPFQNEEDLKNIPGATPQQIAKIRGCSDVSSDVYRICVLAQAAGAVAAKQILVIAQRFGEDVKIQYWREN